MLVASGGKRLAAFPGAQPAFLADQLGQKLQHVLFAGRLISRWTSVGARQLHRVPSDGIESHAQSIKIDCQSRAK
jgi:hypothetical protein